MWHPNSMFERLGLDEVDAIELDCEGGEYDFFECIDISYLKKVKSIICEWHFRSKSDFRRYEKILKKLKSVGFEIYADMSLDQSKGRQLHIQYYINPNIDKKNTYTGNFGQMI